MIREKGCHIVAKRKCLAEKNKLGITILSTYDDTFVILQLEWKISFEELKVSLVSDMDRYEVIDIA